MDTPASVEVSRGFAATLELLRTNGVDWPELEARLEQPFRDEGHHPNTADDGAGGRRRVARGQMSRIRQLPAEIKAKLDELLRSGVSQTEILRRLEGPLREIGERPLSPSGLSRYAREMEALGQDMREMREIADAWTSRLGDEPAGNTGLLAIHTLQTLSARAGFRLLKADRESDEGVSVAAISDLGLAVQRAERSANINLARERELLKLHAEKVEDIAKEGGSVADIVAHFRQALTTV